MNKYEWISLYVLLVSRSPVKAQSLMWTGEIIIKHDLVTTFVLLFLLKDFILFLFNVPLKFGSH